MTHDSICSRALGEIRSQATRAAGVESSATVSGVSCKRRPMRSAVSRASREGRHDGDDDERRIPSEMAPAQWLRTPRSETRARWMLSAGQPQREQCAEREQQHRCNQGRQRFHQLGAEQRADDDLRPRHERDDRCRSTKRTGLGGPRRAGRDLGTACRKEGDTDDDRCDQRERAHTWTVTPSAAVMTSTPLRSPASRALANKMSSASSLRLGSWWNRARVFTPASAASHTA